MAKNKNTKKPKQNKKSNEGEDEGQRLDDSFTGIPGNGSKALNRNNMPKR